jgi:hypothetical protein
LARVDGIINLFNARNTQSPRASFARMKSPLVIA